MTSPSSLALFLSRRVGVLCGLECVGECFRDIERLVEDITRVINRPPNPKFCGCCPTPLDDHQKQQRRQSGEEECETCATPLYCKQDDVMVTCWRCHQEFNAEKLIQEGLLRAPELLYSEREVFDFFAEIGRPLSDRTWRYWRASGKLINRNEWDAEPKYWLADVLHLRQQGANRKAS